MKIIAIAFVLVRLGWALVRDSHPLRKGQERDGNVTLRYVPTDVQKRKPDTGTASRRAALTHDEMEPEPEVREIYKL